MGSNNHRKREVRHSHLIQATLPVIYVIIWILDTQIFSYSNILDTYVPFIGRLVIFIIFLILAFVLVKLSHDALFEGDEPSDTLIVNGILNRVRNPLYLGILLIYVSLIFLSISLICVVLFVIVVLIYNKMVNYEEKVLEAIFGDDYLEYKKKVRKWIPRLF
ncbi:MAG: methyltransferase family protein [Candidatus Hodarchaeota archaeon]